MRPEHKKASSYGVAMPSRMRAAERTHARSQVSLGWRSLVLGLGAGLDRSGAPLHVQLYENLRADIQSGAIQRGSRMPSSRTLAKSAGLSRNTVLLAFQELLVEGYLETVRGSGTYVAQTQPAPQSPAQAPSGRRPSKRESMVKDIHETGPDRYREIPGFIRTLSYPKPFRADYPAIDEFPLKLWMRLTRRAIDVLAGDPARMLGECDAAGYPQLREAIAAFVSTAKGLRCTSRNIVIFAGPQQARDIILRVLTSPGETVWLSDPSPPRVRMSLSAASVEAKPVAIDSEGFDAHLAEACHPECRTAYVFPDKQLPLGTTMSLARRRQLLAVLEAKNGWIIEDDSAEDFIQQTNILPALQTLDTSDSVIYLGSLNKILFPSLRFGYAVVPDRLVEAVVGARAIAGGFAPLIEQVVITDFITEGHLAQHIRRMRKVYDQRRQQMLYAAARHIGEFVELDPASQGTQMIGWLKIPVDEAALEQDAAAIGLQLGFLSRFSALGTLRQGLLLGYGAFDSSEIELGMEKLGRLLKEHAH
ncbi:PLP-dependent aminotransferase family protein [Microvirga tunisiensis]|uniref:8-amino-7-oxononanoate synthase n=1 Tax=Microvirga tunisiensis TaxID=2108360 RepID=A0A5N7ML98_9HYPH|nr:PLP-dependent aminotransferase family protein [Microvirga tunisiensis]MPR09562.1 PLP-dependent aminotransferase family protein [Microvirga tunisiensis]MPR27219.1 PLP-dependent aminotransferase family protein [Microvirga tunisiensis]